MKEPIFRESAKKSSNLKIAYVLTVFPKISESFILNEIIEELKAGVDITIFSLHKWPEKIVHDEIMGYQLLEKIYYYNYASLLKTDAIRFFKYLVSCIKYRLSNHMSIIGACKIAYFATIMNEKKISHIHSHFATCGMYAKELSTILNVPYTLTTHAHDIYQNQNGKKMKHVMEHANLIITISEYNKNYLKEELNIQKNIEIIRCGINLDKFKNDKKIKKLNGKIKILAVSRLVDTKGLEYLIMSIPLIIKENIRYEISIVGSGPLKNSLESLATNLNVNSYITFKDDVTDSELMDLLEETDLFILPCVIAKDGNRDGIPVAIMEAMAMKIPVISTNISGIPELVEEGESGLLVDPMNEQALAKAILELSNNIELRNKMGDRGRYIVEQKYNSSIESKKLIELFQQLDRRKV